MSQIVPVLLMLCAAILMVKVGQLTWTIGKELLSVPEPDWASVLITAAIFVVGCLVTGVFTCGAGLLAWSLAFSP